MTLTVEGVATQPLSLHEELIVMLLNQETDYFHQVPGWDLNCAVIGAVLAELSLVSRIDTDMESLILLDDSEVGTPILVSRIVSSPHNSRAPFDGLRANGIITIRSW